MKRGEAGRDPGGLYATKNTPEKISGRTGGPPNDYSPPKSSVTLRTG